MDESNVYEVVPLNDTAWSVGVNYGGNLFGICTNRNSINIEMCSTGGKIADATFDNTVELAKSLMKTYGIPAEHVVRHYDVCGKCCPGWNGWLPGNETLWNKFKNALVTSGNSEVANKEGREISMQCFYTVDGKGPVIYFDGQNFHPLAHQDEMNIINTIYKANNGKDMPSFNWQSKAPWHKRLENAMKRTK